MTDLIDAPSGLSGLLNLRQPGPPATLGPAGTGSGSNRARRWIVVADGQRLRQLRRQHGMSQEALADRAGISLTTVGRLERQDRPSCRGRTLARLAAVLGEHPAAIMPGPDQPPGDPPSTEEGR
jgi:DNA-binding XRE family transcriptional regulator